MAYKLTLRASHRNEFQNADGNSKLVNKYDDHFEKDNTFWCDSSNTFA